MTSDARSGGAEPCDAPQESASPSDAADRVVELRAEVDQLKEAVTSHAAVDQAIGMVVALGRVSPDQGWAVLSRLGAAGRSAARYSRGPGGHPRQIRAHPNSGQSTRPVSAEFVWI